MKILRTKEENRICYTDGTCHRMGDNEDSGFSEWSTWSSCTVSCGGGQQYRTRICERASCDGISKMARACNTEPCKGEITLFLSKNNVFSYSTGSNNFFHLTQNIGDWSCWSDWNECNENGEQSRSRKCLKINPDVDECQGDENEVRACNPMMSNGSY